MVCYSILLNMSPVEIKGWGMGWSLTTGQFDSNTAETLHHILSSIFSYDRYNGQEYDISWTMPQCVLCLRLIGLFNCFFFCFHGTLFRIVMGCLWWGKTTIEADQSLPWSGLFLIHSWSPLVLTYPALYLQKKSALASSPNILELLSHSFFVGGYFVGPQFTMRKYQEVLSVMLWKYFWVFFFIRWRLQSIRQSSPPLALFLSASGDLLLLLVTCFSMW